MALEGQIMLRLMGRRKQIPINYKERHYKMLNNLSEIIESLTSFGHGNIMGFSKHIVKNGVFEHEESFRKVVNMLRKNQLNKPFQSVKTLEKYERIVELFDYFKPVRLDKNCTKKEVAHKKREKRLDKFKARLDEFWENEYQKKLNYS